MNSTHRFEFKAKISLPNVCTSCHEAIDPKESVALVDGKIHCYHCTNIASYQDYAFYRAKEKVVIKQFFDILIALIFGLTFLALAYLLSINDPMVGFMPRWLAPVDMMTYAVLGALILELPFIGFICRATKYKMTHFFEAIMRFPHVNIYPDYPEQPRYQIDKKGRFARFLLTGIVSILLIHLSPIIMIVRLVQYLNYGAKINQLDDHYLRELRHGKSLKEFNLYVKHADEDQTKVIHNLKAKFGKYPPALDVVPDMDYVEVFRGLRLYRAFRLRYKLETTLFKKYPDAKFIFVISKN